MKRFAITLAGVLVLAFAGPARGGSIEAPEQYLAQVEGDNVTHIERRGT